MKRKSNTSIVRKTCFLRVPTNTTIVCYFFHLLLLLKSRNTRHLCLWEKMVLNRCIRPANITPPQTHTYTHWASKHSSSRCIQQKDGSRIQSRGDRSCFQLKLSISFSLSLSLCLSLTDNYTHAWMCTSMSNRLMECKDTVLKVTEQDEHQTRLHPTLWVLRPPASDLTQDSTVAFCVLGLAPKAFESPSSLPDPFSLWCFCLSHSTMFSILICFLRIFLSSGLLPQC